MTAGIDAERSSWTAAEAAATLGWVRRGGLLLLLDHQPQTRTYAELASALGVHPHDGYVARRRHGCWTVGDCCTVADGAATFMGADGPLAATSHAIGRLAFGANKSEVRTFVGCAFPPVASAAPLLVLGSGGGGEYASWSTRKNWEFDRPLDRRSVAGWWQGAALRVGAGRVVVMCDQSWPSSAAFLKADESAGGAAGGIFSAHNARFAAATFRWLAGELD